MVLLLSLGGVLFTGPLFAASEQDSSRINPPKRLNINWKLRMAGFADPYAEPSNQGWSLTSLDTAGTHGIYQGTLDAKWEFQRTDQVEENEEGGYARYATLIFEQETGLPYTLPIDEYRQLLIEDDNRQSFREITYNNLGKTSTRAGGGGLTIQLPTRIKSKTFRRIFGGDRVGLNVTGDVSVSGGFRRETRDQLQSNLANNANYNFRIDQSQRFTIVGKVGDKVSVRVDQDSERLFEFQNAIKLEYTGYEDEIIQKIEAGNVTLSLPATRLAAFSAQNRGLFGVKTQLKVGALNVTSIASLEKGEKNKITINSGSQQTIHTINNTNPRLNTYFFVDQIYRENFRYFTNSMEHINQLIDTTDTIDQFELYRSVSSTGAAGTVTGWARFDPADTSTVGDQNRQPGSFQVMQPNLDYEINKSLGYVRLMSPLSVGSILACAYTTPTDTIGDIIIPPDSTVNLKLLRPQFPTNHDSTWNLMFRNVYFLEATDIQQTGFELKIKYSQSGIADEEDQAVPGSERMSYLRIFGLDHFSTSGAETPDGQIDNNPNLISFPRGEIIFPDLRPFDPGGYNRGGIEEGADLLAADRRTPEIYDTSSSVFVTPNFKIEAKYSNVSSTFSLGFNVLENSEEVYLNGARLNRGTDYTIDYLSGQLVILNQAALAPGADLEILYESGSIFQLDKKTLLGCRAEYTLWDQSFLGGTVLYLNEKPLDTRVRVGSEPMRNFLWDMNTRLVFKPGILTDAVDALPLVESDAESQITFEGEVAQVYPNPNSLNSPSTGDNQGVAYVDDFESVKRSTPLGIMRRNWTMASYPEGAIDVDHRHGRMIWYNPYGQVRIQEIWPDREVNTNVANNTNVLTIRLAPDATGGSNPTRSWNGIMRYLPMGYNDQTDSKYLEIWMKNEDGTRGKVYVDLGQISEDVIPNQALDTEDHPIAGTSSDPRVVIGNGILDEGENTGLDGVAGPDSTDVAYWNGPTNPAVPSWDDFNYSGSTNRDNYEQINGTENNENDENGRIPDTEDLDRDNYLDLSDHFFRFGFELGNPQDSLKYIAGGETNPYGWRLYRIPLTDVYQTVGSPDWTQISYARIWMTGFSDTGKVSIATIELAGNDWREFTASDSGGLRNYVSVSVVNTHENPLYYPPPGVLGEVDPITNVRSKEQSLSLIVNGLPPSEPVWVVRALYQSESLIEYKKLKMFVHGGGHQEMTFPNDQIEFLFKFGYDTSANYYQYNETLYPGWDTKNEIDIDLNTLTSLKLERPADTTRWGQVYNNQGDSILVVGNPSLTTINYLCFGVRRKHSETPVLRFSTEIWVDELRVSDIYRDTGMAGRAAMTVTFADLATVNAEITAQEAEFHNINVRSPGTNPQDQFNQTYSTTLNMNKFLNPRWGLRLPLTANYSKNSSTPKYYPNSDILVDRNAPPDSVRTKSEDQGASIDFSKTTPSGNPFIKYSIDRLTGNYRVSRSNSSNPTTLYSKTELNSGTVGYNLDISQGNGLGVFSFTEKIPILKRLAETRLYYKPTRFSANLSGSENLTQAMTRTGVYSRSYLVQITRGFGTGFRPIQSFTTDYTRTHRSDLSTKGVSGLFEGDFGRDNNITQTVTSSYQPQFVSFLNTETSYRTTYNWTWGNNYAVSGQNVSNQNTWTATVELRTQDLFGSWAGRPSQTPSSSGQGRPPSPGQPGPEPGKNLEGQPFPGPSPGEMGKEGMQTPSLEHPGVSPSAAESQPPVMGEPPFHPAEPPSHRQGTSPEFGKQPEQPLGTQPGGEVGKSTTTGGDSAAAKTGTELRHPPTLVDGVKSLVKSLGNIRFDYSLTNNLSHPTVTGQADWRYQLGFARSPGISTISGYTSVPSDSRTDDYRTSTTVNLSRNIRLNVDYHLSESASYSSTNTGSTERTQFFILNRSTVDIKDFFMLNWSFNWSGLERTPIFENLAQSVSLDNTFAGHRSDYWTGTKDNVNRVEYSRAFNPLAGVTINWKGGVNSSIRYTLTQTLTDQLTTGIGKTYATQTGLTAQVSYTRQTGFRIPLPFWPFKNKRFSNQTNFSLAFNMTMNKSEGSVGESGQLQENSRQDSWSVAPRIDYTFSNTVTGGVHFETGVNKDKLQGKTTFMEFGVSINIAIRG